MINLLSHIGHTIEAPMLDAYTKGDKVVSYHPTVESSRYFTKADLYSASAGTELAPTTTSSSNTCAMSGTIAIKKGETIKYIGHSAVHAIVKFHDGGISATVLAIASVNEITYTATENCSVVLACDAGVAVTHEYTITTPDSILDIKYKAHLVDDETGKKTDDVENSVSAIKESEPLSNDNALVSFHFTKHNLLGFEDKAKLSLYIFNENYEEAWYKKKAYRFIKTKIECEDEQTD